jgi:hypothetical protein
VPAHPIGCAHITSGVGATDIAFPGDRQDASVPLTDSSEINSAHDAADINHPTLQARWRS